MKLPHYANATIDLAKLRDYVLNPDHPRGKHKQRSLRGFLALMDATPAS